MKTSLLYFPAEVLLLVNFLEEERDINSLAQTNHRFYSLLNPCLYRRNSLNSGSSALLWAAQRGSEATAPTCVSEGANIEAIDNDGRTPLIWAAFCGHEAVVKMLLETERVDVNLRGRRYGDTPLSAAACDGYEAVVKLLLETGRVDVNLRAGRYGNTPLSTAACNGHKAVVKLLLETGRVDVDLKEGI